MGDSTTLYLHVFDWPSDGELLLPGLRNNATAAFVLADAAKPIAADRGENGLTLKVPRRTPDSISSTVVVRITGAPDIRPIIIFQKRDGSITLPACEARLHGSTFQYESGGQLDNIGYWTTPEDWADWEFKLARPGKYAVSAVIAAPASGKFEVSVGGQTLRCAAPNTGSYIAFSPITLGTIEIGAASNAMLSVRPIKDGWQPMNLKAIRLEPVRE